MTAQLLTAAGITPQTLLEWMREDFDFAPSLSLGQLAGDGEVFDPVHTVGLAQLDQAENGLVLIFPLLQKAGVESQVVGGASVQVVHHQDYATQSVHSIARPETVEASRGVGRPRSGGPRSPDAGGGRR